MRDAYDLFHAIVGGVGLPVLIAYTAFAGFQSWEMKKAADSADATLRATTEQFRIQERPYLVVSAPVFTSPLKKEVNPIKPGSFAPTTTAVHNIGKTPSRIRYASEGMRFFSSPTPHTTEALNALIEFAWAGVAQKIAEEVQSNSITTEKYMAPGDSSINETQTLQNPLSEGDVLGIKDGNKIILVYGIIKYSD